MQDLAHFEGPIPDLLDSSMQWLRRNLKTGIRVRPDRLVIDSPGGLWGLSKRMRAKSAVIEYLYDICRLVQTPGGERVIEGEGGGLGEVQRAFAEWPAESPL